MTDPFQMLAQQASQTAALFQSIDRNTQQMFENKFKVQQSEQTLAQNTINMMEQARINDARIAETNQLMQMRQQDMVAQQRAMDAAAKMAPLEQRARQLQLESSIQATTAARIDPQFDDIKSEFANIIFERPDMADTLQREYSQTITRLTQDALSSDVDIVARVNEEKNRLRSFVRSKDEDLAIKGITDIAESVGTGGWLTSKLSDRDEPKAVDYGKAATIYKAFGGDDIKFKVKNDPDFQKRVELLETQARLTGKVDMDSVAMLPEEAQMRILQVAENKNRRAELQQEAKMISDAIRTMKYNIRAEDRTEDENLRISEYEKDLKDVTNEIIRLGRGGRVSTDGAGATGGNLPPTEDQQTSEDLKNIQAAMGSTMQDTREARWNFAQSNKFDTRVKGIIRKILPNDESITNQISKDLLSGNAQLDEELISKAISGARPEAIENLLQQDWFMGHLDKEGMLDRVYTDEMGSQVKLPSEMAKKIKIVQDQDAFPADRRNAINYLKSRLPQILLDYANQ